MQRVMNFMVVGFVALLLAGCAGLQEDSPERDFAVVYVTAKAIEGSDAVSGKDVMEALNRFEQRYEAEPEEPLDDARERAREAALDELGVADMSAADRYAVSGIFDRLGERIDTRIADLESGDNPDVDREAVVEAAGDIIDHFREAALIAE